MAALKSVVVKACRYEARSSLAELRRCALGRSHAVCAAASFVRVRETNIVAAIAGSLVL